MKMRRVFGVLRHPWLGLVVAVGVALLSVVFFAVRVWHGVWFVTFVDEFEHLLGGQMLNDGAVLYRSFVSQHGPVTFMLMQMYGALFGWSQVNGARLVMVGLAVGAAGCVVGSPALPGGLARLWAGSLFLGLLASVWLVQGFYLVSYHPVGGFLLVACLALCAVPAWCGVAVGRGRAAAAGACAALVVATAYSFGPGIALVSAGGVWAMRGERAARLAFVAGAGAAGLGVLMWLLLFGDLLGYLAFHFAENQFVFVRYMTFTLDNFLRSLVPAWHPDALVQAMALLCAAAACGLLLGLALVPRPHWDRVGGILLGCAGLLALNARGGTLFQNGSFVIGAIGLVSLALAVALLRVLPAPGRLGMAGGSLLVGLCVAGAELLGRQAVGSPVTFRRADMAGIGPFELGVSAAPEPARIRALVRPEERMLVVPYNPGIYLAAGRTPMERYFYYLPWDADYAKAPWFGQAHDLCEGLASAPPRLIYFDHWKVWDRYDMRDYMPCFVAFLDAHYTRQAGFPNLYLRAEAAP